MREDFYSKRYSRRETFVPKVLEKKQRNIVLVKKKDLPKPVSSKPKTLQELFGENQ